MPTHYWRSRCPPAARLSVGRFVKRPFSAEILAGVATFSVPMSQAVIPALLDGLDPRLGVELGRFVLLDEVEANGEIWTLGKAFRLLGEHLPAVRGVVSFCDPVARSDNDGNQVKPGHVGIIYRAVNATARGRSKARTLLLAPDGSVISERAVSKLRNGESGADYVERSLRAKGAAARGMLETGTAYLTRLRDEGFFRTLRHPGNLAFSWALR